MWLTFFVVFFFSFMVHKVRDTFVWKLNGDQNKKIMGEWAREEGNENDHLQSNP